MLAFVVMLIPLLTANVTDAEESTTTMYLRAAQHEQDREYDKAMALYKRILVKEDSPTVLMKMYELELKRNNSSEAEKILKDAYKKYPQHAITAFNYGVMLSEQAERSGRGSPEYKTLYTQAVEAFQSAANAEPTEQSYVALAIAAT